MDDIKKENYQLTVYKLNEFQILEELRIKLLSVIENTKKVKNNNILQVNEKVKVFYLSFTNENNGNDIAWFKKWNSFFGITEPLRSSSTTGHGAIIIELTEYHQQYLLTFGRSAALFKEIVIHNYGIIMAEKLFNGENIDSVSSKYFSLTKNKSLISYAQGSSYDFEEGEAADLLKGTIEEHRNHEGKHYIEELLEYVKPLATIGYTNIKLTLSRKDIKLTDLIEVINLLYIIENSYDPQLNIPQMQPIRKDQEKQLNDKLWTAIKEKNKSIIFSVPIFSKDIDDYYVFLDSIDSVTLKYNKSSKTYENFCVDDLFAFIEENPKIDSLNQIRCIIKRNQIERQKTQIQEWLEAQIELDGIMYALHNGKWYSFNDYYLKRVDERIKEIEMKEDILKWDDSFSTSLKTIDDFCRDNSDEVINLFSEDKNIPLTKIYREFKYNFYISKIKEWNLFDRCISGSVELCDLSNPNESFIHCKIGKTANLEECLRQSMLSLLYFSQNQPLIESFENKKGEKLTKPKEIVVLYLSESDIDLNFKISALKSLKCKLTFLNWFNQCKLKHYKPKLIVAKYNKM